MLPPDPPPTLGQENSILKFAYRQEIRQTEGVVALEKKIHKSPCAAAKFQGPLSTDLAKTTHAPHLSVHPLLGLMATAQQNEARVRAKSLPNTDFPVAPFSLCLATLQFHGHGCG